MWRQLIRAGATHDIQELILLGTEKYLVEEHGFTAERAEDAVFGNMTDVYINLALREVVHDIRSDKEPNERVG